MTQGRRTCKADYRTFTVSFLPALINFNEEVSLLGLLKSAFCYDGGGEVTATVAMLGCTQQYSGPVRPLRCTPVCSCRMKGALKTAIAYRFHLQEFSAGPIARLYDHFLHCLFILRELWNVETKWLFRFTEMHRKDFYWSFQILYLATWKKYLISLVI